MKFKKVKLTNSMAGVGWSREAGEIIDLPAATAKNMMNSGQATEVNMKKTGQENAARKTTAPKGRERSKK